jgi:hypothetical protein
MTDLCVIIIIPKLYLLSAYIMKPITDRAVNEVSFQTMENEHLHACHMILQSCNKFSVTEPMLLKLNSKKSI